MADITQIFHHALQKVVESTPEFETERSRDFVLKTAADKLMDYGFNEIRRPEKVYKRLLTYISIYFDYQPRIKAINERKGINSAQFYSYLGYASPVRLTAAHPIRLQVFINCMEAV